MFPVETLNRIVSLSEPEIVQTSSIQEDPGGQTFLVTDKRKEVKRILPDYQSEIVVTTLTGLVDLMEAAATSFDAKQVMIHVASETEVRLKAKSPDDHKIYVRFAKAERPQSNDFVFGQYMRQEDFVIALRSLFVQTPELDDLVGVAGNLAAKSELKQEDDGFTQSATMKSGVHMLQEKVIKPRVTLKPFRTFLEAEQPNTEAIFRIKDGGATGITCALFAADGGNWKLNAIQNVKTWISNRLKGSTVDGLPDIPVIA